MYIGGNVELVMENELDLSHILGHIFSAGAIIGTFSGWLPGVAAIVALVWYAIQIYESKTMQNYFRTRRDRNIAAYKVAIAKLEAREKLIGNIYGDNPHDDTPPR